MFHPCCDKTGYKMSTTQNVILRVAIVLGMMVAVVAILYLTPLPEQHFQSCDRPCQELDWPMICRVKLEIATHENCNNCLINSTNYKEVITVNRQMFGPSIQVCQNDVLVVDVINKIPEHSLTVHWRGQSNNEAPYMDGVPLITQCPIQSYSTFQYKFRVSSPGTHLYHGFSDKDRSKGFFGALIVRQPDRFETQRKYYDVDSKRHVIIISEMFGALLINGKARADLSIFNVKRNKRYRFRVGYTGKCPVSVSIDDHLIKIIALDGNPVSSTEINSVVLSKGERLDFVLKTNQITGGYFLRVKSCDGNGLALINYEGNRKGRDDGDKELKNNEGSFDTALCESRIGRVCLDGVKSARKIPDRLRKQPEKVVYLSFDSRIINVNGEFSSRVYSINNLTFSYPPSPLLTQLGQIPANSLCDGSKVPENCEGAPICECVHVEFVPLGASTEIVVINQDASEEEHVVHLHGYSFYVVGFRQFDYLPTEEEIRLQDQQNVLFKRNFNNPVLKDTIRVPRNGVVAVRFLADNPGFWMLRDEKSKGWTRGMDVVFQVGEPTEMVSAPTDFPTCGNYIGPDFFLM